MESVWRAFTLPAQRRCSLTTHHLLSSPGSYHRAQAASRCSGISAYSAACATSRGGVWTDQGLLLHGGEHAGCVGQQMDIGEGPVDQRRLAHDVGARQDPPAARVRAVAAIVAQ